MYPSNLHLNNNVSFFLKKKIFLKNTLVPFKPKHEVTMNILIIYTGAATLLFEY